MGSQSLLKITILGSLLFAGTPSSRAQLPLDNLVSQIQSAVVIVSAYDEQGNTVTQGTGFFISADRIATNLDGIGSARHLRIRTSGNATMMVRAAASYPNADLAILQLSQPARDVIPLKVGCISQNGGSRVVLDKSPEAQWNITAEPSDRSWRFEHISTHLHVMATLVQSANDEPAIKLKGHANGTALSVH